MKKLILFIIVLITLSCNAQSPTPKFENSENVIKLNDSIKVLNQKLDTSYYMIRTYESALIVMQHSVTYQDSTIKALSDSVYRLNLKPLMTSDYFLQLYKFDRLFKYYKICVKNPSQWKFYKGWTKRVFEE
jgi:hypothetical protein